MSLRVKATAIGSVDSLLISITSRPPWSATAYTRCTASPLGMRNRVSTTGTPARRVCRTLGSFAGLCQRSSAATYQSRESTSSSMRIAPRSFTMACQPPARMPNTCAAGRTVALSEIEEISPGVLLTLQVLPKLPRTELVEFALALSAHERTKCVGCTDFPCTHRRNLFTNWHLNGMAVSKFNHRCRTFHALGNHVH